MDDKNKLPMFALLIFIFILIKIINPTNDRTIYALSALMISAVLYVTNKTYKMWDCIEVVRDLYQGNEFSKKMKIVNKDFLRLKLFIAIALSIYFYAFINIFSRLHL